mmetsp:Transcript_3151/g.7759  ORF Transcript_3151/g.7759 Transcript_3151/m.7759 type:complete len:87 (+) Transcript_3151:513-773(+)
MDMMETDDPIDTPPPSPQHAQAAQAMAAAVGTPPPSPRHAQVAQAMAAAEALLQGLGVAMWVHEETHVEQMDVEELEVAGQVAPTA